jgi:cell division septum initiation protein DivIVA
MDYQWIHEEAVSNAGRYLYRKVNGQKVKVGTMSVDSVLGEAGRYESYISHVENPMDPVIIFGDKDKGIEAVRERVNEWYEGTKDARGHKIRYDGLGLLSGTVSWPPQDDNEDKKAYYKRLKEFELALLDWLKEEYGDDLVLVLRHDDEPFRGMNAGKIHYHWHFFCVKKPGEKFDLHPGFFARSEYNVSRQNRKNMTKEELKATYKKGQEAYRKAMINLQDKFYEKLGRHHGLNRLGPMRLRRSRWEEVEKEAYEEKELAYAKQIMTKALRIKAEADALLTKAKAEKTEAKNIKIAAQKVAEQIISKGKSEAEKLLETAKKGADKITKDAESTAQNTIGNAWQRAQNITETAQKQAVELIEKSNMFIDTLLEKVSKLPGGVKIIRWARAFIYSVTGKREQIGTIKRGTKKPKSR